MMRYFILAVITMILLFGCTAQEESKKDLSSTKGEKQKKIIDITEDGWDDTDEIRKIKHAEDLLNLAGLDSVQVQSGSPQVVAIYQPLDLEYEYEIVNDWAKIFGILSEVFDDSEYISIEQMYGGEKVFSISSKTSDIDSLESGEIDMQEFKLRLYLSPTYVTEEKQELVGDEQEKKDVQEELENTEDASGDDPDVIATDFWADYIPQPEICSIKTDKETMIMGDQAQIKTWATAPPKTPIAYLCGDEEVVQLGAGGIRTGSRFCRFYETGIHKVWISIGGKPCNHVEIEVTED